MKNKIKDLIRELKQLERKADKECPLSKLHNDDWQAWYQHGKATAFRKSVNELKKLQRAQAELLKN